jgi:endonuclease/exonuclease/phosphatase (EEP) superfamily protein YafD
MNFMQQSAVSHRPEKWWHVQVSNLAIPVLIFLGLPTILGFLGRSFWMFELLSHFRTQYFLGLMVAAIMLLGARRFKLAALACSLAAFNGLVIVPLYFGGGKADSAGAAAMRELKVVSLNVHSSNVQYATVRAFLLETDPDIAILLEVTPVWFQELQALREAFPHVASQPQEDNFGIAVFSRIPFDEARIARSQ